MKKFIISSEEQWYTVPKHQEAFFRNLIGQEQENKIDGPKIKETNSGEILLLGKFIKQEITAFYHDDYYPRGSWRVRNTIANLIWTLKNDINPFPERLNEAQQQLSEILKQDLPIISQRVEKNNLTVCVVPRAKAENYYKADQLLFRKVVSDVVDQLPNFQNGTNYIIRHTNTRTTHLDRSGGGGDGDLPYPGITKDTCTISDHIKNKDILLIDDLYTKRVNIDEDAIQALLDMGAKSVTFYSVGKTLSLY